MEQNGGSNQIDSEEDHKELVVHCAVFHRPLTLHPNELEFTLRICCVGNPSTPPFDLSRGNRLNSAPLIHAVGLGKPFPQADPLRDAAVPVVFEELNLELRPISPI